MKQLFYLVVSLLVGTAMVSAEGVSPVLYGGAGIGMLVKPSAYMAEVDIGIGDTYKSGANFGGGVGFQLSPNFELVGRLGYNTYSFDEEGLIEKALEESDRLFPSGTNTATASGDKLQFLEINADLKASVPIGGESGTVRPFLLAGLGFAHIKMDAWNVRVNNDVLGLVMAISGLELSEMKLMFNIGGGLDWMASPKLGVFADVRYTQVAAAGDPIGYLPVRVGLILKLQ